MKEFTFLPTDEYVRPLGRSMMREEGRLLYLSGSGVEFAYTGTKLALTFYGDSSTSVTEGPQPWRDQARIAVIVDGVMQLDTMMKKPVESFVVCGENDTVPQAHTVQIVKLSEPRMSAVCVGEITVTLEDEAATPADSAEEVAGTAKCDGAYVHPTKPQDHMIEYVGDSITCGYGIDAPNENHPFCTGTENVTKGYAYLTAQALKADVSLISYSGHGLISGYTPDPQVAKTEELIQPYYDIEAYSYNQYRGLRLQDVMRKRASERTPDLVVINLGTNDDSYVQQDENKKQVFRIAYEAFLEQVHTMWPQAAIVIAFGLMGDNLYAMEEAAAEDFKKATGYERISCCHLTPQDPATNGYAADYHPSAISHRIAAKELSEHIAKFMNW